MSNEIDTLLGGLDKTPNRNAPGRPGRPVTRNEAASRPPRVPIGSANKLAYTGDDPRYHYRMVNDTPGRLDMFCKAGYEFCYTEIRQADKGAAEGGALDTRVSVDAGRGIRAYRMRIPNELYEQDQAAKYDKARGIERQLHNPNPNPRNGQYDGLVEG